jgi:hypothetical protein
MMEKERFIDAVFRIARSQGYRTEFSEQTGYDQIDFGNKKLHAGHIGKLYPAALIDDADISLLIDEVAPGRPCSHRPMREIIEQMKEEYEL